MELVDRNRTIAEKYKSRSYTQEEIGKEYGISRERVRQICYKLGVKGNIRNFRARRREEFTERIVKAYKKYKDVEKVAKLVNRTEYTVSDYLKNAGYALTNRYSPEELEKIYELIKSRRRIEYVAEQLERPEKGLHRKLQNLCKTNPGKWGHHLILTEVRRYGAKRIRKYYQNHPEKHRKAAKRIQETRPSALVALYIRHRAFEEGIYSASELSRRARITYCSAKNYWNGIYSPTGKYLLALKKTLKEPDNTLEELIERCRQLRRKNRDVLNGLGAAILDLQP